MASLIAALSDAAGNVAFYANNVTTVMFLLQIMWHVVANAVYLALTSYLDGSLILMWAFFSGW